MSDGSDKAFCCGFNFLKGTGKFFIDVIVMLFEAVGLVINITTEIYLFVSPFVFVGCVVWCNDYPGAWVLLILPGIGIVFDGIIIYCSLDDYSQGKVPWSATALKIVVPAVRLIGKLMLSLKKCS